MILVGGGSFLNGGNAVFYSGSSSVLAVACNTDDEEREEKKYRPRGETNYPALTQPKHQGGDECIPGSSRSSTVVLSCPARHLLALKERE